MKYTDAKWGFVAAYRLSIIKYRTTLLSILKRQAMERKNKWPHVLYALQRVVTLDFYV